MQEALQENFPSEHALRVAGAIADGLTQALAEEGLSEDTVMCARDYSTPCPEGFVQNRKAEPAKMFAKNCEGWAELDDGETCVAPTGYEGANTWAEQGTMSLRHLCFSGECGDKEQFGAASASLLSPVLNAPRD